jgi:hypothetical protein
VSAGSTPTPWSRRASWAQLMRICWLPFGSRTRWSGLDRGFGDIRRYPPGSHPGIVVLRLADESALATRAAIMQLLDNHDLENLAGTITVVQHGSLRIRRPTT